MLSYHCKITICQSRTRYLINHKIWSILWWFVHTLLVRQSADFLKAQNEVLVPFLHHQVVECDCNGQSYTLDGHDITLNVPEGAVDKGQLLHFEIGVSLYGPFSFPENTQPISPIVWVCLLEEHVKLKEPFQLIIPHIISKEKLNNYEINFSKANHDYFISRNGNKLYRFYDYDFDPLFVSIGHRSYGILVTNHFCFYCLKANTSAKLAVDAGYSLARIENILTPQRNEVIFCATYFLETCIKVR